MKKQLVTIAYFDTETTGIRLSNQGKYLSEVPSWTRELNGEPLVWSDVVQLSAVCGEMSFDKLIKCPLAYRTQDVTPHWYEDHGIKAEDLRGSLPAYPVIKSFMAWLQEAGVTHLVAHNIRFDTKVLIDSYARGMNAKVGQISTSDFGVSFIDSRDILKETYQTLKDNHHPGCFKKGATCDGGRLTHMHHALDLGAYNEHNSLADSRALREVCETLNSDWIHKVQPYEYVNFSK